MLDLTERSPLWGMEAWKVAALGGIVLLGIVSAHDGPNDAIVIGSLPFSTTGDSTGFSNAVDLGAEPNAFFAFTGRTEVRQILEKYELAYFRLEE